jgi:hypothetical protein
MSNLEEIKTTSNEIYSEIYSVESPILDIDFISKNKVQENPVKSEGDIIQQEQDKKERLEDVMADLEQKLNPKSVAEGVSILLKAVRTNDQKGILAPIQSAAKEFEERVGRPMSYCEMRMMFG